jgi:hypothetical protein
VKTFAFLFLLAMGCFHLFFPRASYALYRDAQRRGGHVMEQEPRPITITLRRVVGVVLVVLAFFVLAID